MAIATMLYVLGGFELPFYFFGKYYLHISYFSVTLAATYLLLLPLLRYHIEYESRMGTQISQHNEDQASGSASTSSGDLIATKVLLSQPRFVLGLLV